MPARVHGRSKTRTYHAWNAMHRRCDGRDVRSPDYLAKGIQVCQAWSCFETFAEDMGECPAGMTLDRIDNAKGYAPGNCRWATRKEQIRNRDCTAQLIAFGQTKPLHDWCDAYGISANVVKKRLSLGWTPEDALTKPLRSGGYKKKGS